MDKQEHLQSLVKSLKRHHAMTGEMSVATLLELEEVVNDGNGLVETHNDNYSSACPACNGIGNMDTKKKGWLDGSTAPRDGSIFLALIGVDKVVDVPLIRALRYDKVDPFGDCWETTYKFHYRVDAIDAWMPMPGSDIQPVAIVHHDFIWNDMSTAPKDGTCVMLLVKDEFSNVKGEVITAKFINGDEAWRTVGAGEYSISSHFVGWLLPLPNSKVEPVLPDGDWNWRPMSTAPRDGTAFYALRVDEDKDNGDATGNAGEVVRCWFSNLYAEDPDHWATDMDYYLDEQFVGWIPAPKKEQK